MNTENIKQNITAALAALPDADFPATAQGLLETLERFTFMCSHNAGSSVGTPAGRRE